MYNDKTALFSQDKEYLISFDFFISSFEYCGQIIDIADI